MALVRYTQHLDVLEHPERYRVQVYRAPGMWRVEHRTRGMRGQDAVYCPRLRTETDAAAWAWGYHCGLVARGA